MFARTTIHPGRGRPRTKGVLRMRKTGLSLTLLGVASAVALSACSSGSSGGGGGGGSSSSSSSAAAGGNSSSSSSAATSGGGGAVDGKGAKVGIILPDTTSSPRWITADPDALKADCQKA